MRDNKVNVNKKPRRKPYTGSATSSRNPSGAALHPQTPRPTKIELCRSSAVGTRTPGTALCAFAKLLPRGPDCKPKGGRAVGGEGGGTFSLQVHPGRQ